MKHHHHQELNLSATDIAYSSSIENYDDKARGVQRRRHLREDHRDFKIKHYNLTETSFVKTTWIEFNLCGGCFSLSSIMMKSLSS